MPPPTGHRSRSAQEHPPAACSFAHQVRGPAARKASSRSRLSFKAMRRAMPCWASIRMSARPSPTVAVRATNCSEVVAAVGDERGDVRRAPSSAAGSSPAPRRTASSSRPGVSSSSPTFNDPRRLPARGILAPNHLPLSATDDEGKRGDALTGALECARRGAPRRAPLHAKADLSSCRPGFTLKALKMRASRSAAAR